MPQPSTLGGGGGVFTGATSTTGKKSPTTSTEAPATAVTTAAVVIARSATIPSGGGGGGDGTQQMIGPTTRLTVKPHPFIGAILSPKHAMELTPTLCLQIASALADLNMASSSSSTMATTPTATTTVSSSVNLHQRHHSPTTITTSSPQGTGNNSHNSSTALRKQHQQQPNRGVIVPYTVWITEAWRVLGWAEPSAALFWEMATMYYALIISQRESSSLHHNTMIYNSRTHTYMIPPILSCSSTGSVGSHGTTAERTPTHTSGNNHNSSHFPYNSNASNNDATGSTGGGGGNKKQHTQRLPNSVASAKELPVWLVSTFLLLHCEEFAIQRNLSGQPLPLRQQHDQPHHPHHHFYGGPSNAGTSSTTTTNQYGKSALTSSIETTTNPVGKMDFSTLFNYPSSLSRTRLHATWRNDHRHCTAYLLRHLRKVLLLCAVSHSKEAQVACLHLASMPTQNDAILSSLSSTTPTMLTSQSSTSSAATSGTATNKTYDADEIRRLHDDEHGNVGVQVRLTLEDLECLDFIIQSPNGGMIDEPCIRIGELMWRYIYDDPYPPPTANIQLGDVERELRQHLEMELSLDSNDLDDSMNANVDCDIQKQRSNKKKGVSSHRHNGDTTTADETTGALSRLSLSDRKQRSIREKSDIDDISNQCYKEITYTRLRGTTIMLKPNPPEPSSAAASVASGEPSSYYNHPHNGGTLPGRLYDLVVSDCSDAHFYLLQPFEHVTIAACSGCTIVIGAVAGLLHIVDCEKTVITFAARRVLISNSCDVQSFLFTPSPPLLVGDNRACQFAPYNTYYDGMREDLLTTGLAALAMTDHSRSDNEALYPLLQCASNKWKQPIELSKLEVPQVPGPSAQGAGSAPLSPGADDRAMAANINTATMQTPVLVPPSEYHILFVPIESESFRLGRSEMENVEAGDGNNGSTPQTGAESQYCRLLAEVLQLSPFRLPLEYERSALLKAERMKTIQQAVQKNLSPEQQQRFEEELNRGFRDWLVSSGNLRQVLDLVHMENKDKVGSQ